MAPAGAGPQHGPVFKSILVCLDGSQLAEQILPHAEAAAVTDSRLTLLLIMEPPNRGVSTSPEGYTMDTFTQTAAREAQSYVKDLTHAVKGRGFRVTGIVLEAAGAGKAIIDYASDNRIDLIAIATHGHGGLRRVVVGSTADYVLRHSPVPVLMIAPT